MHSTPPPGRQPRPTRCRILSLLDLTDETLLKHSNPDRNSAIRRRVTTRLVDLDQCCCTPCILAASLSGAQHALEVRILPYLRDIARDSYLKAARIALTRDLPGVLGSESESILIPIPMSGHELQETIPAGYLPKPEAMKLVGRSVKPFEKLIRTHGVQALYVKAEGRRPIPTYRQEDLEALLRPVTRRAPTSNKALVASSRSLTPLRDPSQIKQALLLVSPDRKHLLTAKEAHALGWPYKLLDQLRKRENPPGIWCSTRIFKFSAEALKLELEG